MVDHLSSKQGVWVQIPLFACFVILYNKRGMTEWFKVSVCYTEA